jgi:SnoaL-like domain
MPEWYETFYASIDAMDPAVFDERCTHDTRLRLGSHEPIVGREAVVQGLVGFWSTIRAMRHEFTLVIEHGDTTVLEGVVHYTLPDESEVHIPVVTMIRRQDGLVADQRVYGELSLLNTPA